MRSEYTIKRHLEKEVMECVKEAKVPCLIGQRQIGKTTLLKAILPKIGNYTFVRLDDKNIQADANNDPSGFLHSYKKPLCIDEVQKAPMLFEAIKNIVDDSNKKGQFVLTGSESISIIKGIGDTLSTRASILKMLPLSNSEIYKKSNFVFLPVSDKLRERETKTKTPKEIFQDIIRGSMPDIINGNFKNISRFYKTYCETTVFKDLKEDLIRIQSQSKFLTFTKVLASYVSQEINYSNIAKIVGVDYKTVQSWINALEGMNLIFLLHPYSHNSLKRTVKSPKLYFYDTGIICYLMNYQDPEILWNSEFAGKIFECYAISEITKGYFNAGQEPSLFYLQDWNKKEVDLIIEGEGGILYPIEVKKTIDIKEKQFNNFSILKPLGNKVGPKTIVCCAKSMSVFEKDKKFVLPVYWI